MGMHILRNRFRENLQHYLTENGIKRSELARRLNVSRQYITNVLNGHCEPTWKFVEEVADALGIEPHELFLPVEEKIPA